MGYLLRLDGAGRGGVQALPDGAFLPAPEPWARPDVARLNAGQGDVRAGIRPNVKFDPEPGVTVWESGPLVRLDTWLAGAAPDGAGVVLMPHEDPAALSGRMQGLALVALWFQRFSDGRASSNARLLRRLGWQGRLRAVGDVLVDQIFLMSRCGFDEFALRGGQDPDLALRALDTFSAVLQHAEDERAPWRPLAAGTAREAA